MNNDHTIFCLPGILGRSKQQFSPVADVLMRAGHVEGIDYQGHYFDGDGVADHAAASIHREVMAGNRVTVIGASLGGMVIPHALKRLPDYGMDMEYLRKQVRSIILDAPFGSPTMYQIWPWAALPASILTQIKAPLWLNDNLGKTILESMAVPPEWDNIDVPPGVDSEEEYKQRIIDESMEGMRGHEFSMFASQLGWMTGRGCKKMPFDALRGFDTTYVAYIGPQNKTVRHPAAVNIWRPEVSRVVPMENVAHTSFREQKRAHDQLFTKLFNL